MMNPLFIRFSLAAAALLVSVASFGQFLTPDLDFFQLLEILDGESMKGPYFLI